ncbi:MAG: hydrogenase expression/formation protein HypE [Endomicrobiia bacterium]|nr:hydrogenase expression/formation protein HypE [Endomicrobiaceae bacterium]MDD3922561.1 hydrogenase expression/formation protein HypE [Endomicrobiaceae bacterium]
MINKTIDLSYGSGGEKSNLLIKEIKKNFNNEILNKMDDAGLFNLFNNKLVFSTDSFVIDPIFFNGGDIGKLSVCGTINDISMMGAKPLVMSLAMIIEEGFSQNDLLKISASIAQTAKKANVKIITGDTKVVNKGKVDKIFINTSAIGIVENNIDISASNACEGDDIIVSGNIGEHTSAIMMHRNNFNFKTKIKSDCNLLNGLVSDILKVCKKIHVLRDPTRGGVSAVLNEISQTSKVAIVIDEKEIPISNAVKSFCRVLGLDPIHMANEGKLLSIQPHKYTEKVLQAMKKNPLGKDAKVIGKVVKDKTGVWIKTPLDSYRKLVSSDLDQYPRIC